MSTTTYDAAELARSARLASRQIMISSGEVRNRLLDELAKLLLERSDALLAANEVDLANAHEAGLNAAFVDRLRLTPARLEQLVDGVRQVRSLPDPVGLVTGGSRRPNGLEILRKRVPLGVVAIIFESRPNVVIDAAILCLKAGNACILKGGKEAFASQEALIACVREALHRVGLPEDCCQGIASSDRALMSTLLKQDQYLDVVIPRGGEGLIRSVVAESTIPVIKHYTGVCHVYIDEHADLDMAERITLNAKVQRPGVCNAAETLLVHRAVAERFLPQVGAQLHAAGVELRACPASRALLTAAGLPATAATEEDWPAEYLTLILAVRVVDSLEDALDHIERYGSRHTDAIVTREQRTAMLFAERVDSAAVMVNASTRFSDGYEFGLGAEIGISTDKLHARGPMGLESLTCEKWVVLGDGQVRG